eukprot:TRINITY_DN2038_c0_g4_i1.p1 TRINITY_DN2038_c0_g4~~TRINITY_DN2038_c0_g4_i1.p1  ORF type:complete len:219 (+),score=75.04 TRINITY_DN2038_c0_g4_i1:41-697(+)
MAGAERWRECLSGGCSVLLLRHGTTSVEMCDDVEDDLQRRLSPRGEGECAHARAYLAAGARRLRVVLSSTADRCRETALRVAGDRGGGAAVAVDDALYGPTDPPADVLTHFRAHHGASLQAFMAAAPPSVAAFLDSYVADALAATAAHLPDAPLLPNDVIVVVGHSIYISCLAVALAELRGCAGAAAVVRPVQVRGVEGFVVDAAGVTAFQHPATSGE